MCFDSRQKPETNSRALTNSLTHEDAKRPINLRSSLIQGKKAGGFDLRRELLRQNILRWKWSFSDLSGKLARAVADLGFDLFCACAIERERVTRQKSGTQ